MKTALILLTGIVSAPSTCAVAVAQETGTLALIPFDSTQATIAPGASATLNLTLDTDLNGGDVLDIVLSDPTVSIVLNTPASLTVNAATASSYGIQWSTMSVSDTPLSVPTFLNTPGFHTIINLPAGSPSGQYHIVADGTRIATPAAMLVYYVSSSAVGVEATASPATSPMGTPVAISAIVLDDQNPVLGATTTAAIVPVVDVSSQASVAALMLVNRQTDEGQNTTTTTYSINVNNAGSALVGASAQFGSMNLPAGVHVSASVLQIGSLPAQSTLQMQRLSLLRSQMAGPLILRRFPGK